MNAAIFKIDRSYNQPSKGYALKFTWVFLILFSLLCFKIGTSFAEDLKATDKVDAVLLVDASGSMRVTDPKRLRNEGARLFSQFLKDEDRVAVIEFSDTAKIIRGLESYSPSKSEEIRRQIDSVGDAGKFTDISAGISEATRLLRATSRGDASKVIILLSDGRLDPAPGRGTSLELTNELLDNIIPTLKQDDIKIYTLAFSDQVDRKLLSDIASGTGAVSWYTPDADTIHESFADLFLVVKKPQVVPLSKKGFRIDPDIEEATFYINRQDGVDVELVSPTGENISAASYPATVRWFKGQKFEVVTITRPESGNWQISGVTGNDSFATVLTNLKLITEFPVSMYAFDPVILQGQLYESKKPVVLPEMTSTIDYAYQVTPTDKVSEPILRARLLDDGKEGDKIMQDGVFAARFSLTEPGEYKLRVVARGPTFERNQQIPFRVKPPLVALTSEKREEEKNLLAGGKKSGHEESASGGGSEADVFLVTLSEETVEFSHPKLRLLALSEDNKRYNLPVTQALEEKFVYECPASKLPREGKYRIQAILEAEGKRKKEVTASSQILEYEKRHGEAKSEVVEIEVQDKAKEKPVAPESPLTGIIIITLVNLGAAGAAFSWSKKNAQGSVVKKPDIGRNETLKTMVDSARDLASKEELDLNDPRLKGAAFEELSEVAAPEITNDGSDSDGEGSATDSDSTSSEDSGEDNANNEDADDDSSSESSGGDSEAASEDETSVEESGEETKEEDEAKAEDASEDES